jgi:hypothetical protein
LKYIADTITATVPPHAAILGDELKQKLLNSKDVLVIEAKA